MFSKMMRLVRCDGPGALMFDRMCLEEYEPANVQPALDLLLCDGVVPVVDVPTSFAFSGADFAGQMPTDREREAIVPESAAAADASFADLSRMDDGQKIRFIHAPTFCDQSDLEDFLAVKGVSDLEVKGGMISRDVRAWLVIAPVVGILYHPAFEGDVHTFIATRDPVNDAGQAITKAALSPSIRLGADAYLLQAELLEKG